MDLDAGRQRRQRIPFYLPFWEALNNNRTKKGRTKIEKYTLFSRGNGKGPKFQRYLLLKLRVPRACFKTAMLEL